MKKKGLQLCQQEIKKLEVNKKEKETEREIEMGGGKQEKDGGSDNESLASRPTTVDYIKI